MERVVDNEGCKCCPASPNCKALYRGKMCAVLRRAHGLDIPMTIGERIRRMSDGEWAASEHFPCPYNLDGRGGCKFDEDEQEQTCEECKLEWLKQLYMEDK